MMGWPISQDYNEAIQNPATSFAAPDLKTGEVVTGPLGLPMPRSGNFADVYQMIGSDGRKWAIKCFTRQVAGLRERYAKIDTHLHQTKLPFSVGFQFLEQGIRIRGQWYPILKMEWVEGITLNEFVRQYADKPLYLRALLGLWLKLSSRLRDAKIAHADLQHGNVLLVPGATANKLNLKLIDYDGMWVPALAKVPSGEAGHPAYQHPWRLRDRVYSADVDRFPHLVIACALRATALGGKQLWNSFDNGDNLLFREIDFAQPQQSKLLRTLWEMDDPTITNLLALMVLSSQRPLSDTPWVDEVLVGETTTAVSDGLLAKAADVMGVPRREVRRAMPTAQLYVTPDQVNELPNAYEEMATAPLPRRYRRKRSTTPLLVGGLAMMTFVVGVVAIVYSLRSNKEPPEAVVVKKNDPEPPPKTPERTGKLETNWRKTEPGPPTLPAFKLADDIDQGSDTRLIRHYGNRPASLAVALSLDGTHAIHVGRSQLGVTNLASGELTTFGAEGPFNHGLISPDTRYIVTVSQERAVHCWQVESRTLKWTINFPERVTALAITPDSRHLGISGVGVGYLEWSLIDNKEVRRHPQLQANEMYYTPDGEKLLTRVGDQLELWELDQPERKGTLGVGFDVRCCAISANGREIWAAGKGPEVRRWNTLNLQPLPSYAHGRTDVQGLLSLHRPTGFIIRDSQGGGVCLDQNKASMPDPLPTPLGLITSMFATRDYRTGILGNEQGFLLVRLVSPNKTIAKKSDPTQLVRLQKSLPIDFKPTNARFDASGKFMLAHHDTKILVGESATANVLGTYEGKQPILAVGFSADERLIVTEGTGPAVQTILWDWKNKSTSVPLMVAEGEQLTQLRAIPHAAKPNFVLAYSAKQGHLLFDTQTGKPVVKWINTDGHVTMAVPAPDGQYVAYSYARSPVRLWDVDSQETLRTLEGSEGVLAVAFTPDGKKLVGLWPLGRMSVWDADSGKIDQAIAHDYDGPFTGLQILDNKLVLLQRERDAMLLQLDPEKMLDFGKAPSVMQAAKAFDGRQGRLLHADQNTLDVWNYDVKQLAELPEAMKPVPANPDLLLARDGPLTPITGMEISTDGGKLLMTTQGQLMRFDRERLSLDKQTTLPEQEFRHLTRSGNIAYTINTKGDVRKWDIDRWESISGYALGLEVAVASIKPDSESLLLASDNKLIELNMPGRKNNTKNITIQTLDRANITRPLANIAFTSDAKWAVLRWDNGMLALWKVGDQRITKRLIDSEQKDQVAATSFALSPTGKYLVYGTKSGYIRLWDTGIDKKPRSELAHRDEGKPEGVSDVVMCSTGTHFLTRGLDGKIILWNITTWKKVKEYTGTAGAGRLVLSPNEQSFIVATAGRLEQWKMPDLAKE